MTDSKQSVKYRLVAIVLAALETLLVWKGRGSEDGESEDGPLLVSPNPKAHNTMLW